jgi:hypothetical protein
VHRPVEKLGDTLVHARICFLAPTAMGMGTDALGDPRVASIVCSMAGEERLRIRHTRMIHVFLAAGDGVVLRSRFWIGSAMRPYGPLGGAGERILNNRLVRARAIPRSATRELALHCAEEFSHLAVVLPELHERFCPPPAPAP